MSDSLLERLEQVHAPVIEAPIENHPGYWFWITEELGPIPDKFILISDIQKTVAKHYGLVPHDLTSDCRTKREVMPRHIAMYLCRVLTKRSHSIISRWFNRCDHSISIYAFYKIKKMMADDPVFCEEVESLRGTLA